MSTNQSRDKLPSEKQTEKEEPRKLKRLIHPPNSERETFHMSLSGAMLYEFRRILVRDHCTANHLLNQLVKKYVNEQRKKEAK